jgi:hypothetical protein
MDKLLENLDKTHFLFMFDNSDFPKSLDESLFETWLEEGRMRKIGYKYMIIVWDVFETKYFPVYTETREKFADYEMYGSSNGSESLVAIYDLYSHSKISYRH